MPSKKIKNSKLASKSVKNKKADVKLSSYNLTDIKDEVVSLASVAEKKDQPKSITLGELMLGILIIAVAVFIGYKKYTSTKNELQDTAKLYKSEAMSANLALFFNQKSYYPTEAELKDENWLISNAPKLSILSDDGFNNQIGGDNYKYQVFPEECDNQVVKCDGYKISINPSSNEEIIEQTGGSTKTSSDTDNTEGTSSDGATDENSMADGLTN